MGLPDPGENLREVLKEVGRPLVGLAAHEAVEIVEPHPVRPLVEWAGRTVLVARGIVVLAKPGCRVAILLEDRADGGVVDADDAVVARIAGGLFGNDAEADRVVVASGDQCGPRR